MISHGFTQSPRRKLDFQHVPSFNPRTPGSLIALESPYVPLTPFQSTARALISFRWTATLCGTAPSVSLTRTSPTTRCLKIRRRHECFWFAWGCICVWRLIILQMPKVARSWRLRHMSIHDLRVVLERGLRRLRWVRHESEARRSLAAFY